MDMNNLIKNEVNRLVKKHNTNNPFEIANGENIIIIKEPLGNICGYYNKIYRQKFIHINSSLNKYKQLFTCAHELGHSTIHPDSNTPFLRSNTFFSVTKLENQANLFAAHMLIPDNLLNTYEQYSLDEIAAIENLPIQLLKLKFQKEF